MKTTIDFPDELLHRAKVVAAQRRTTLKELVLKGLDPGRGFRMMRGSDQESAKDYQRQVTG